MVRGGRFKNHLPTSSTIACLVSPLCLQFALSRLEPTRSPSNWIPRFLRTERTTSSGNSHPVKPLRDSILSRRVLSYPSRCSRSFIPSIPLAPIATTERDGQRSIVGGGDGRFSNLQTRVYLEASRASEGNRGDSTVNLGVVFPRGAVYRRPIFFP